MSALLSGRRGDFKLLDSVCFERFEKDSMEVRNEISTVAKRIPFLVVLGLAKSSEARYYSMCWLGRENFCVRSECLMRDHLRALVRPL